MIYCARISVGSEVMTGVVWLAISTESWFWKHFEEILVLRRVWITLRQQLHECLSPEQGRVVGQLLK